MLQLLNPLRRTRKDEMAGQSIKPRNHPGLSLMVEKGRISHSEAARVVAEATATREPVPIVLKRLELATGHEWAQLMADHYGLQQAFDDDIPSVLLLGSSFATRYLKQNWVLPLAHEDETLWLGMADPSDEGVIKASKLATKLEIVSVVVAAEILEKAFGVLLDSGQVAMQSIIEEIDDIPSSSDDNVDDLVDRAKEGPVIRLVNQLISDALLKAASDIHLEPFQNRLQVRYRIHGRMQSIEAPPAGLAAAVISRIKILARLDIAERRMPQDGRCQLDLDGRRVDMRVATMPTIHGESIVIRLLDASGASANIESLGLSADAKALFVKHLSAPHGMVLVTGPTGSGKTTTLYAGLKMMDASAGKIISIEDPIEYQIDGVNQIQVKSEIELDFARVLRSIVRHDPDTIMVGETRDGETAEIAVHAALTGHLVLTTLHTNSAAGAIGRLLDMGIEPYLLASVIRLVVGQRLVGELCNNCRESSPLDDSEADSLRRAGQGAVANMTFYKPVGCKACNDLGFTGRIGIFETLAVDETVRELIRAKTTTQTIQAHIASRGMVNMFQDGIAKAMAGRTSLSEVMRVTEDQ